MDRASRDRDEPAAGQPHATALRVLLLAVFAVAIALRLWNFAGGRSLFHDEVMVGLNIVHLPLTALFGELHFDQMAPVGWLVLEKLGFAVWPDLDYGLRFLSLVGGIATVLIFWRLARSTLEFPQAVLALALFALASNLIRYSAMVKPYIFDAMFSAAILAVAVRLVTEAHRRGERTLVLGLLGIACIPLAFGGVFVLASTGLVLFTLAVTQRNWRWTAELMGVGLAWATLLAAVFLFSYGGHSATVGNMGQYWADAGAFAPVPTTREALAWYPHQGLRLLIFYHHSSLSPRLMAAVLGAVALLGAIGLVRRQGWMQGWILALLLGPVLIALAASMARVYPLENRLQLALAVPLFILAAHGVGMIAAMIAYRRLVLAALAVALLAGPLAFTASRAGQTPPWAWEESKPNLDRLAQSRSPQDVVLVSDVAEVAVLVYAGQASLSGMAYRVIPDVRQEPRCILRVAAALPAEGRVWLLTFHTTPADAAAQALMFDTLKARAEITVIGDERGSKLYRIDLKPGDGNAPIAPTGCDEPRSDLEFRHSIARSQDVIPQTPEGLPEP